jgi:hypothetical protein
MGMFTYNGNIPFATNNPSVDQPDMETNTNSIASLIQVDHQGFNLNQGGFHTVVHCIDNIVDPAPVPPSSPILGAGEYYSKSVTTDSTVSNTDVQAFYQTAGGVISQLTGSLLGNTNITGGFAWSGGLLIQWGSVIGTLSNGTTSTVTFKDRISGAIPFPNNCFAVLTTLFFSAAGGGPTFPGSIEVRNSTLTNLSFQWICNTLPPQTFTGFNWVALGN